MSSRARKTVAGVDGAKGGWVIARFDGTHIEWSRADDVRSVLDVTADCASIGVDMPLSMPSQGYRVSEVAAKVFLGTARSSIFHTPVAAVMTAGSYSEACEISREVTGKAISKQAWFLLDGVRSWREADFDDERVVEVHPECSFRCMSPTTSFASKKSGRGAGQRLSALAGWADPREFLGGLATLPVGSSAPVLDDALDAAAAAWSAWRYSRGEHRVFGTADAEDRIVA